MNNGRFVFQKCHIGKCTATENDRKQYPLVFSLIFKVIQPLFKSFEIIYLNVDTEGLNSIIQKAAYTYAVFLST